MKIDYGVIGEGELTMAELAGVLTKGGDINTVKGIAFYDKRNELKVTNPREVISDLDSLPFPDYEGLGFSKWLSIKWIKQPSMEGLFFDVFEEQRLCEIVTSRSCPFNCTFCYHPLGQKYRQRSLDNVFKEIIYLIDKYNINLLNILDELFSLNEKRIYEFTSRIKKYNIRWMAQWRADNVNEQVLKEVKECGILTLGIGVESMSDRILESMKKKVTKADIERAFKLAHDAGVRASGNIILGDPEETEETIKESIDWWKNHIEYDIHIRFILAVPDSKLWRHAIEHNLIGDKVHFIKSQFPVINLTKMSDYKFNKIRNRWTFNRLTQKYLLKGKELSSKKEPYTYEGKDVYAFRVECPLCHHISTYKYFRFTILPNTVVICKQCLKRLKIETNKVFINDYKAFAGFVFYYVVIFYNVYFKKYGLVRNMGKVAKKLLSRYFVIRDNINS